MILRVELALLFMMGFGLSTSLAWETKPVVRMAHIEVKPELKEAFIQSVTKEMRASLQKEKGVLALYCVADKANPNKLIFFEIYASEDAYQSHRETSHFKKYIQETKEMSLDKYLLETIPLELQDQWHK